ncbi:MAG: ribonuclease HII [Clostridia bacterium]|nr:ribonuclease HII [Clostridia bacterium]
MIDTKPLFEHDLKIKEKHNLIAGLDEVGRGPLAGPVVTACVIMPYDVMIEGVYDSKRVSAKKREKLYDEILSKAIAYSITLENEKTIDEINILQATKKSMVNSYNSLSVKPDVLLVDAVKLDVDCETLPIIKGDSTSYAIACASIIAKVYRDRMMDEYALQYPMYDFENNKGYGTKKHIEALKNYGKCPIHRDSFISNFVPKV